MRVNIASFGGRSHLLDLARELDHLGHDVRFYSYVPTKRAKQFGLRPQCNSSYFLIALPFIALMQLTRRAPWSEYLFQVVFDHLTAWFSRPCDVFIGQSPMHVYSLAYARKKHGAFTILERGNSHVLSEIEVLSKNPKLKGAPPKPHYYINRDLKGYEEADFISIASDHVRKSFVKNGYPKKNLWVNPYGVSTEDFYPTELSEEHPYDLLFVGQWCFRKGCDFIIELCEKTNLRFLHVGPIVDLDFPKMENMHHVDAVDQKQLVHYYKKAKVFVLPSREEGLAMVQMQAVMCGLPVVCSPFTGGRDLKHLLTDCQMIHEIEHLNLTSLEEGVRVALGVAQKQAGIRNILSDSGLKHLSWEAYGRRYSKHLTSLIKPRLN